MRLWYSDRSVIIASEPFNFITVRFISYLFEVDELRTRQQEHDTVIAFFLPLIHAELSCLGWDPTMERVVDANDLHCYCITVRNADGSRHTYRTCRLISDDGAQAGMRGRGTRVWEAVRVVDGVEVGEPVVIKDAWVDAELQREGDTMKELREEMVFLRF